MSARAVGLFCLLAVVSDPCQAGWSEEPAAKRPRADCDGDPLPPGALARLGTARLRSWELDGLFALSADGKVVTVEGRKSVIGLRDAETVKELIRLTGHQELVSSVVFSRDGRTVFSGGHDRTVRAWDPETGRELYRVSVQDEVGCLGLSPDGTTLASNGRGLQLHEATTGKELGRFGERVGIGSFAFSPDGKTLASGGTSDRMLRLWKVSTGKELRRAAGFSENHLTVAFSPDGRTVATASWGQRLRLLDATTFKEVRSFAGGEDNIGAIAFSPNGWTLATTGWPGPVRLWTVEGRQLFCCDGPEEARSCVCFSPDGRTLAASGYDRAVRLWEVATGKERRRFEGHRDVIWCLTFAPDGRRLASGSGDKTVLVWDVTGRAARPGGLSVKDLGILWSHLAGEDAAKAHRAIWALAAVPRQTLPFLRERLRPGEPVPAERLAQLVGQLDGSSFVRREKAARELERLGEAAEPTLRKVLAGKPALEMRRRAEEILAKVDGLVRDPELLRGLRVIEVLEQMADPGARQLLQKLAGGAAEARLTQEASAALKHLQRK